MQSKIIQFLSTILENPPQIYYLFFSSIKWNKAKPAL